MVPVMAVKGLSNAYVQTPICAARVTTLGAAGRFARLCLRSSGAQRQYAGQYWRAVSPNTCSQLFSKLQTLA